MPDYEVFAPDDATMRLALKDLGFGANSGRRGVVAYAFDYYGTKYVDSGGTWVAQPGVYANVRWVSASVLGGLSASVTALGATMTPLTAPYYHRFFG
jgi:hypothetical protein